ncbi:hypothetical protein [Amorphus sp. 3PC139-8]|uniref:hypothetical protein n=1 Tax=Amorphus sp. 3PC139-8 TaxID=2735676 RepID=UPI00345DDE25
MSSWLAGSFGLDPGFARGVLFVLTLALLVAVIWAVMAVARAYGSGALGRQRRNRQPRLAVMDSADIDHRHRLVLVRRDHVEHLILIGGPVDVVVEEGIIRNATAASTDTLVRSNAGARTTSSSSRGTFAEDGEAEADLAAAADPVPAPKPAPRTEAARPTEPPAASEPPARPVVTPPQADAAPAEAPRRPQRPADAGDEPRRRPAPKATRSDDTPRPATMRPAPTGERPAAGQGGSQRPNSASAFRRPQTPRAPLATPTAPAGARQAPTAERPAASEQTQPRRPEPAAADASTPSPPEQRKRPNEAPDDELMAALPTAAAISPSHVGRISPSPEPAAAQDEPDQQPQDTTAHPAPADEADSNATSKPDESNDDLDLDDEMARLLRGVGGR